MAKAFLQPLESEGSTPAVAATIAGTRNPATELKPLEMPVTVPLYEGATSITFMKAGTLQPFRL